MIAQCYGHDENNTWYIQIPLSYSRASPTMVQAPFTKSHMHGAGKLHDLRHPGKLYVIRSPRIRRIEQRARSGPISAH